MIAKPTILNTRPLAQQHPTAEAFEKHGFDVINLPCIEINTVDDAQLVKSRLNDIANKDVIIFTSQNAVKFTFLIEPNLKFADKNIIIAVGTKTSEQLEQYTNNGIWVPEQQNSDGIINLLKGFKNLKSIKLISAANGRKVIQQFVESNNISLQQINVYQRQLPKINQNSEAFIQIEKRIENLSILITSVSTLINLQKILSDDLWRKIKYCRLLCASERIAEKSLSLGFCQVDNMNTAKPENILKIINK